MRQSTQPQHLLRVPLPIVPVPRYGGGRERPHSFNAKVILNSKTLSTRKKLILTGLYLSKFDQEGLKALGFNGFFEAYNAIGYALKSNPLSIRGYRDEFDPYYPNSRKGWNQRVLRKHCEQAMEEFRDLDLHEFAQLVRSFASESLSEPAEDEESGEADAASAFAQRMITGIAAENYFLAMQPNIDRFSDCSLEDTTKLGCGYDFRLWPKHQDDFLAVEVKGMRERNGWLSMTEKEHECADQLAGRFFLFVVKNFREKPFHEIHENPLRSHLQFKRKKRVVVHISWLASA